MVYLFFSGVCEKFAPSDVLLAVVMIGNFIEEVLNPARLAALRRLGILDTPAEAAIDRLGALASKFLKAPVALVTLVDDKRQFFKSCLGLPEPWSNWRDTPLSHSFCQHVLATDKPLIVSDARSDPLFRDNLAVRDLGVVAYLGIPLKLSTGEALGSFCVIDNQPRLWTPDEVQTLTTLAMSVMTEVELRSEIRYKREAFSKIESLNKQLHSRTVELEASNEDLEAFNHSISHDLQAPIRSLKAFSQILIEDCAKEVSAECQDYLGRIQQSIDRLENAIRGLSVLSGLGRSTLKIEEISLTGLAQEIIGELQVEYPERQVGTIIHPDLTPEKWT